jgi:hypothetical protein
MRISHLLATAAAVVLLSSCSADRVTGPTSAPGTRPVRDNGGWIGSGGFTAPVDGTTTGSDAAVTPAPAAPR